MRAAAASARAAPRRGLTLLELAVVLAIIAILAALAAPTMARRLATQRAITAAEMLAADVAEARFEAARRGQALHLLPQGGPQWCWALSASPTCPCGEASACALKLWSAKSHPAVSLAAAEALRLDPEGRTSGGTAAVFVSGEARVQVRVSPLGRARVCDPSGTLARLPAC